MKVTPPRQRDPLTMWLVALAALLVLLLVVAGLTASVVPIPNIR